MSPGSLLLLGITGTELTPEEAARFRKLQPAGYILFSRNIETAQQTRQLTDDLRSLHSEEPLIAIDQEGGRVERTSAIAASMPSAPRLAAQANFPNISDAASLSGKMLNLLGINFNLAPVLDLEHFPGAHNALTSRCWGRDPQRVIDFAGYWNRTHRKQGIATCGKHFPAGGRATSDPHHDLPSCGESIDTLLREDIIPYTALITEIDAVMLAHISFPAIDPDLPASLSPRLIRDLLRNQLGFDHHLVLTDDLDMQAIGKRYGRGEDARLAILAGADLALICHRSETADLAAKAISSLPTQLLDEALDRVELFRRRKITAPPAWSDQNWQQLHEQIGRFCSDYCTPDAPNDENSSPVESY
ncbi:MAG: beta-N-acetylhexosaminidase [Luteolibacter sp.]